MNAPSYYNTTRLSGPELAEAITTAKGQDAAVLALFRAYGSLSPSLAWEHYKARAPASRVFVPLTSIRRAISTLTKAGLLEKTDIQVPGEYSVPEHVWRLAQEVKVAA